MNPLLDEHEHEHEHETVTETLPCPSSERGGSPRMRRAVTVLLVCGGVWPRAWGMGVRAASVDVWIDLDAPVPAGSHDATEANKRRQHVEAQQQAVWLELERLGAVELARVRHVRNAIAVRIAPGQLDAVRALAGVARVRPVSDLHPPEPGTPSKRGPSDEWY